MTDDEPLIRAARQGQTEAFGRLVRKYQDRLFNAIVYTSGSPEEAEDVVQETFVQAYLKLHSFAGNSAFFTWLYRIAFNTAISRRRRRKNELSVDAVREASGQELSDDGEAVTDRVLREERAELIRQALQTLSEEHRAILVLREMEGCDYEAIAQILDLPVGTVRSRLHRARLHLKAQLEALLADGRD